MDAVRQNPIWLTCKPLQRMCNNKMQHITRIRSSLLMFPLTPDQHHWLDVATEDEGWCSFRSCTPSRSRARTLHASDCLVVSSRFLVLPNLFPQWHKLVRPICAVEATTRLMWRPYNYRYPFGAYSVVTTHALGSTPHQDIHNTDNTVRSPRHLNGINKSCSSTMLMEINKNKKTI